MKLEVRAQLVSDDGNAIWGYHHESVIVAARTQEEAEDVFISAAEKILGRIDEAKEAVSEQIRAEGVKPRHE